MKRPFSAIAFAVVLLGAVGLANQPAQVQRAVGSTAVGVAVAQGTPLAFGWSVKQALLGKVVYNDAGQQVGKIDDLVISPDIHRSFAIVGAGGFFGFGRLQVAVPVMQIEDHDGRLVLPGSTRDLLKSAPALVHNEHPGRHAAIDAGAA